MLGLIWIQTVRHWWFSWKNFSKELILQKISRQQKSMKNYPACRVKTWLSCDKIGVRSAKGHLSLLRKDCFWKYLLLNKTFMSRTNLGLQTQCGPRPDCSSRTTRDYCSNDMPDNTADDITARGGPTLTFLFLLFLVDDWDPNITYFGQSLARQRNTI